MVVYKYKLVIPNETYGHVDLPVGAKILKIESQRGDYYVWCLVDENQKKIARHKFLVAGTGHVFKPIRIVGLEYIDTVITHGGSLVFHFWMER